MFETATLSVSSWNLWNCLFTWY